MSSEAKKVDPLWLYFAIFFALMALLIATVWASYFDLGAGNAAIALTIAVAKAMLVILFFMHVRHAGKLVWIFAGAAFLWLGILLSLTLTDYASRPPREVNPTYSNQTSWPIKSTAAVP